jgi:hypothetical protein
MEGETMRIVGRADTEEVVIIMSIEESRRLIVDHGENELVIPNIGDTIGCLEYIQVARAVALRGRRE